MMDSRKIQLLVVDDDEAFRELLIRRFSKTEFEVVACESGEEALEIANQREFDIGLLDIMMPGISGIDLLREIKIIHPEFEAIIITGQATVDSAIESMRLGAFDYLAKPCKLFELELIIRKAFETKMLREQNSKLREGIKRRIKSYKLRGSSEAIRSIREQVTIVSSATGPVLVAGENGAGKETVAISVHQSSNRKDNPFVAVNCGVLKEAALEVELFGHEANAFVGAGPQKRGLIENTDGGTVMLKEIEQVPSSFQVKLLHFLDTGEFRRVGGHVDIFANTRLILSTSEDLLALTKRGMFRDDFYYKISTLAISVPPLRDRKEDIPELANEVLASGNGVAQKRLAKKAVEALLNYNWPGNVRELSNVLERAAVLSNKNVIQMKDLPLNFEKKSKASKIRHLMSLNEIEKEHILFVLDTVNGNISRAAKILGVSRPKLYRKIEKYRAGASV